MNILLVEDEKIQREALASIIKSNFVDVRIYEAASKKEALKIINEKDVHLFFIDIHLKDSSGLELAKKIRQHEIAWGIALSYFLSVYSLLRYQHHA